MPNFNKYQTANTIVQKVCEYLGLPVPVSASGATDQITRQMWQLLTECGQEIVDEYEWQIINKVHEFVVQDPVLEYALPEDLAQYIDSSGWNITSRIPLIGPLTTQQWQLLQARQLGGTTLRLQYIIEENLFKLYWAPSEPNTISIAYQSRGWVRDGTTPTTYRDEVQNDADVVLLDSRMIRMKLALEFRRRKGFDVTDDEAKYEKALAAAKYDDRPKNDLKTAGSSSYPYLGYLNMPDTNYGSP